MTDPESEKKALISKLRDKGTERSTLALRGSDLSGSDLSGLDLSGLDLRDTNLTEADLSHAMLRQTDLRGANLFGARLNSAELLLANLQGARLDNCTAEGTGFGGANLREASFSGGSMAGSTFSRSDLSGSNLRVAELEGARFRESKLRDADLAGARLTGVDLGDAELAGANFRDADLREASFAGASGYRSSNWIGVDIRDADFRRALQVRRVILDENYLFEFRTAKAFNEWLYRLWKLSSDCGRSLGRWTLCTLGLVFLFSLAFSVVDMDFGHHAPNFLSSFYFSIVTLTTLGYGDILPSSPVAQVLVILEVALGYMTLGGLISIFANKMARRAE